MNQRSSKEHSLSATKIQKGFRCTVAGQLSAFYLARVQGRDPDAPRGLREVTVTR